MLSRDIVRNLEGHRLVLAWRHGCCLTGTLSGEPVPPAGSRLGCWGPDKTSGDPGCLGCPLEALANPMQHCRMALHLQVPVGARVVLPGAHPE